MAAVTVPFDVFVYARGILRKPETAAAMLAFWFVVELVFPSHELIHVGLLYAYVTCLILLIICFAFGKKRLEEENKALAKVSYVGDLIFLKTRSGTEHAGILAWFFSVFVSVIIPLLLGFSFILNLSKLIQFLA